MKKIERLAQAKVQRKIQRKGGEKAERMIEWMA